MQPYSDDRHSGLVAIIAVTIILVGLMYFVSSYMVSSKKINTLIIREAMEKNVDVNSVRCILYPEYGTTGCDMISAIKEVRVDPRFAPRDMPSVGRPIPQPEPEIQP